MRYIGKKVIGLFVVGLALVTTAAFVPGCNGNGGMDGWNDAEFEIEQNGELEEGLEETGRETGEALEEAGEETGEMIDETGEGLEEFGEETRERMDRNGDVELDRTREYNGDYIERDTERDYYEKHHSY